MTDKKSKNRHTRFRDDRSKLRALKACQDALRPLDHESKIAVYAGLREYVMTDQLDFLDMEDSDVG